MGNTKDEQHTRKQNTGIIKEQDRNRAPTHNRENFPTPLTPPKQKPRVNTLSQTQSDITTIYLVFQIDKLRDSFKP